MINKNWQGVQPDSAHVEQEIVRLNEAVGVFAEAMKTKLAQKAREGWTGWDDEASADKIYTTMLAHAAGIPLAKDQEVDIANLAMMLWHLDAKTYSNEFGAAPEIASCIGCGCTDFHACYDVNTDGSCSWLVVNYKVGRGVCSCCADQLERWNAGDTLSLSR